MFGFLVFPIYNLLCNLIMTWVATVYPIYRTVKILNKKEVSLYTNYLSFWFFAGIIFAFEWCQLHLVIYPVWFQLKMTIFLVLQWNSCTHSRLVYSLLTPLLDEHEEGIITAGTRLRALSEQVKDEMVLQVSKYGPTLLSSGQQFVGEMLASQMQKGLADSIPVALKAVADVSKQVQEEKIENDNSVFDGYNSDDVTLQDLRDYRAFKKMQESNSGELSSSQMKKRLGEANSQSRSLEK